MQVSKRNSNEMEPSEKGDAAVKEMERQVEAKRPKTDDENEEEVEIDVVAIDEDENDRLVIDTVSSSENQTKTSDAAPSQLTGEWQERTLSENGKSEEGYGGTLANSSSGTDPGVPPSSNLLLNTDIGRRNKRRVQPPVKFTKPKIEDRMKSVAVPGAELESPFTYFYQASASTPPLVAGRFGGGKTGPPGRQVEEVALDLSMKKRVKDENEKKLLVGRQEGVVRTCAPLTCVTLPTVLSNEYSELNRKRPSVIRHQDLSSNGRYENNSSTEPDVQEHFRKSLSSQRVYGASAEVEDHFARALGRTWWKLKEALSVSSETQPSKEMPFSQ